MGRREQQRRQDELWIAHSDLPRTVAHPFYEELNRVLEKRGFDEFVEQQGRSFYAVKMGRPSLAPGAYFRLLLIGYFEGIDSERGIAWRTADSLALRRFLGLGWSDMPPDHSTLSRTRRLIDLETHQRVFVWVLGVLAEAGLLKGRTLGVDATTLEANAALRSIVRRDTGEGYQEFLKRLAQESGIPMPTRDELARLDRKRKKKGSNQEWVNPHDGDARTAKMKDGRTHLAHKAEHAVDLESGAVVAVSLAAADQGDTTTMPATVAQAGEHIAEVAGAMDPESKNSKIEACGPVEVVADKGCHSNETLVQFESWGVRSYISEPERGQRQWLGKAAAQQAVYGNRRRIRGERGKRLLRQRGELVERSFAHCYDTGGLRRTHLRGHSNIFKRQLIHVAGFNLSLVMRQRMGKGTPRGWQGISADLVQALVRLWIAILRDYQRIPQLPPGPCHTLILSSCHRAHRRLVKTAAFTTGC